MDPTAIRRKTSRAIFSHGIDVQIFAIDGTCTMFDVSENRRQA